MHHDDDDRSEDERGALGALGDRGDGLCRPPLYGIALE
jgi:hypothetical protein